MRSVEIARIDKYEVSLEITKEIKRGHGSAREKRLGHPPVVFFEMVRLGDMAENVHKQDSFWFQPSGYLVEEEWVSFHVLEHFNRHDVCESVVRVCLCLASINVVSINGFMHLPLLFFKIKHVDISSDDRDVVEPLFFRDPVDVDLLSLGIGQHGDFSEGIML